MDGFFIVFIIGLPIILIIFVGLAMKKIRERKLNSEEKMQSLLRNINQNIDEKKEVK